MGRINEGSSKAGIGRDALLQFIDELNDKRAIAGIRQRYEPVLRDGELTMKTCDLPSNLPAHSRSRPYAN